MSTTLNDALQADNALTGAIQEAIKHGETGVRRLLRTEIEKAVEVERYRCYLQFLESGDIDLSGTARSPQELAKNQADYIEKLIADHKKAISRLEALSHKEERA